MKKLEELILSVLSLIILVPIIYFFPLGLTNKGKAVIIITSFLLANIGLLSQNILPLWILWLVLALLVFLITYVMQDRFREVLFAGASGEKTVREPVNQKETGSSGVDHYYSIREQQGNTAEEQIPVFSEESAFTEDVEHLTISEQEALEDEVSGLTEEEDEQVYFDWKEDVSADAEQIDASVLESREEDAAETEYLFEDEKTGQDDVVSESRHMGEVERFLEEEYTEEEFSEFPHDREEESPDAVLGELPIDDLDKTELSPDLASETADQEEAGDSDTDLFGFAVDFASEAGADDEQLETLHKGEDDAESLYLTPDEEMIIFDSEEDGIEEGGPMPDEAAAASELTEEEELFADFDDHLDIASEIAQERQMEMTDREESPEVEDAAIDESMDLFFTELEEVMIEKETETDPGVPKDEFESWAGFAEFYEQETGEEDEYPESEPAPRGEEEEEDILDEAFVQPEISTSSQMADSMVQTVEERGQEEEVSEETRALQQQMFHLLVSQLEMEGKRLPAHQYEMLIKEHMIDSLSPRDYYTFASMLTEHYIRNKELGKLNELLCDLREKFAKYPVLSMEIQYLYEQYCKNAL